MKKVSFVLIAAFIAASAMFVGCGDDEAESTISVKVGGTTYTSDVTIDTSNEGEVLNLTVTYIGGAKRVKKVFATATISGSEFELVDTTRVSLLGDKEVKKEIPVTVPSAEMRVVLRFQEDTKSGIDAAKLVVTIKPKTVTPPPPADDEWTYSVHNAILGAQNAATGSFFSVETKTVLKIAEATSQSQKVDFAYYYGSQNAACIAAPGNADAQTITYGSTRMSSWTTKNETKFFKSTTLDGNNPAEWWEASVISATNLTATHANQLAAGNVVVFETAGGARGAFVVASVNGTNNQASISIKLISRVAK